MKNTNKLILGTIVLLMSSGIALSSAFANAPAATDAAQEVVTQTTGDMAKEAATEVVDSATEQAVGMAKDEAHKAVDSGMTKAADALHPAEKAADAAAEATK